MLTVFKITEYALATGLLFRNNEVDDRCFPFIKSSKEAVETDPIRHHFVLSIFRKFSVLRSCYIKEELVISYVVKDTISKLL